MNDVKIVNHSKRTNKGDKDEEMREDWHPMSYFLDVMLTLEKRDTKDMNTYQRS